MIRLAPKERVALAMSGSVGLAAMAAPEVRALMAARREAVLSVDEVAVREAAVKVWASPVEVVWEVALKAAVVMAAGWREGEFWAVAVMAVAEMEVAAGVAA